MNTRSLAMVLSALALAVSLAGCSAASAPAAQTGEPTADALDAPADPVTVDDAPSDHPARDACAFPRKIHFGDMSATLSGRPVDLGPRELATGTVNYDRAGNIVSYTVAVGDAPAAIGDRLCIESGTNIPLLNHVRMIHPGQVLRLTHDRDVLWVPYFNPEDAPAGFQQAPYQQAIEAMGAAADAGDIETMRLLWIEELAGMFTDQADIDAISQALEAGDFSVLRQMFS